MSGWTGPLLGTGSLRKEVSYQHGRIGQGRLRRPLTPREREVLLAVSRGLSTEATGRYLGIGEQTVKSHRQNIRNKLHVHTMAAAASLALREGWIS